jgi:hypothetical protein
MSKQLVASLFRAGTFMTAAEVSELLDVEAQQAVDWILSPVTVRERVELLQYLEAQQQAITEKLKDNLKEVEQQLEVDAQQLGAGVPKPAVQDAVLDLDLMSEPGHVRVQSQTEQAVYMIWLCTRRTAPGLTREERQQGDWNTSPELLQEFIVELAARHRHSDVLMYAIELGQQARLLKDLPAEEGSAGKVEGGLVILESEDSKSSESASDIVMS